MRRIADLLLEMERSGLSHDPDLVELVVRACEPPLAQVKAMELGRILAMAAIRDEAIAKATGEAVEMLAGLAVRKTAKGHEIRPARGEVPLRHGGVSFDVEFEQNGRRESLGHLDAYPAISGGFGKLAPLPAWADAAAPFRLSLRPAPSANEGWWVHGVYQVVRASFDVTVDPAKPRHEVCPADADE